MKGSCSLPVAEVMGTFHQDAHAVHSHDSHHQQAQRTQLQGREGEGCTLMAKGRAAQNLLLPDRTPWLGECKHHWRLNQSSGAAPRNQPPRTT